MGALTKIKDLLWPTLGSFTHEQIVKKEEYSKKYGESASILEAIKYINDESYAEEFAKTAKSLFEDEEARLKTVEGKSVTLLSASGLIITLVVNFSNQILLRLNNSTNKLLGWVMLFCFALTIVYFFRSVVYSLRGLSKGAYFKLDIKDIINSQLQNKKEYFKRIAVLNLANRTKNYGVINQKVDCAYMSNLFFTRGIITLILTAVLHICTGSNLGSMRSEITPLVYICSFIFIIALVLADLIVCCLKGSRKEEQSS